MQCPVCDERTKEVERFGVSIDICPGCKGVWLDRGELDKPIAVPIVDRLIHHSHVFMLGGESYRLKQKLAN